MRPGAVVILVVLCWSLPAGAKGFFEAREKARRDQDALGPQQMVDLAGSLNRAMEKALTECIPRRGTIPDSFAVVFKIGAGGRATDAWTRDGTRFERCFAASMRQHLHYVPPTAPFHTAIE